jgi:hypothetical protein
MEEYNLSLMDQCYHTTLGTTSRVLSAVIFLLITSCAYHTEIPCPFGLAMKQLDEKCDYIQHGSTTKWVLKKKK